MPAIMFGIIWTECSLMLIYIFFIIFENRLILKYRICYSNLRSNFIKRNSQNRSVITNLRSLR